MMLLTFSNDNKSSPLSLQAATGGEDAYFISLAGHGAVGVSDGVSAWAEDGIDPGEYSRTLVQYCSGKLLSRYVSRVVHGGLLYQQRQCWQQSP